jgi:hypothetical protein
MKRACHYFFFRDNVLVMVSDDDDYNSSYPSTIVTIASYKQCPAISSGFMPDFL